MRMMEESQSARTSIDLVEAGLNNEKNQECCSETMMAKIFINILLSALLSPFMICDFYFGIHDHTCITEQTTQMPNLGMRTYLIVSGSMTLVYIVFLIITIFAAEVENKKVAMEFDDETKCTAHMIHYFARLFNVAWIISGCVLFWGYMDIDSCSTKVHDYLFARFIIGLIGAVSQLKLGNNDNKR
jgi:hypothetical protein